MSTTPKAAVIRPSKRSPREPALEEAYIHLSSAKHTTKTLAKALGVSSATAFRLITALRRQGVSIESVKRGRDWYFEVDDEEVWKKAWQRDRFLTLVGFVHGGKRRRGQTVDEVVYRRK